jgi:predicted RNase H-like HicB family nuclease
VRVEVCLEVGPDAAGAFVPDYPGCWVFGRNEDAAMNRARKAILEWHSWVKAHGESIESPTAVETDPAEVMHVPYNPAEAGKPEPLFWSEVLPVSVKDIGRTMQLMEYSRRDFLESCSRLRRDALRWKPKSEPRSVNNCLRHIAIAE